MSTNDDLTAGWLMIIWGIVLTAVCAWLIARAGSRMYPQMFTLQDGTKAICWTPEVEIVGQVEYVCVKPDAIFSKDRR